MPEVRIDISLLDQETLDIEGDIVFKLRVLVGGPLVLSTADGQHREELVCSVFVQEAECRSDSKNDLLRCASRRIEQLATEAHARLVRGTL